MESGSSWTWHQLKREDFPKVMRGPGTSETPHKRHQVSPGITKHTGATRRSVREGYPLLSSLPFTLIGTCHAHVCNHCSRHLGSLFEGSPIQFGLCSNGYGKRPDHRTLQSISRDKHSGNGLKAHVVKAKIKRKRQNAGMHKTLWLFCYKTSQSLLERDTKAYEAPVCVPMSTRSLLVNAARA